MKMVSPQENIKYSQKHHIFVYYILSFLEWTTIKNSCSLIVTNTIYILSVLGTCTCTTGICIPATAWQVCKFSWFYHYRLSYAWSSLLLLTQRTYKMAFVPSLQKSEPMINLRNRAKGRNLKFSSQKILVNKIRSFFSSSLASSSSSNSISLATTKFPSYLALSTLFSLVSLILVFLFIVHSVLAIVNRCTVSRSFGRAELKPTRCSFHCLAVASVEARAAI